MTTETTETEAKRPSLNQVQPETWDSKDDEVDDVIDTPEEVIAELFKRTGIRIISPYSTFRNYWDRVQVAFLMYVAVMVPFRIGFEQPAVGLMFVLEFIMGIYFILDIFLNFATAYKDKYGMIVADPISIASNYFAHYFWIDVVACIPVDIILRVMEGTFDCSFGPPGACTSISTSPMSIVRMFRLLRLFKLIRLLRLSKVSRIMQKYQDETVKFKKLIRLLSYMGPLLYLGHIFGCFFFFFSGEEWQTTLEKRDIAAGLYTTWTQQEFAPEMGKPVLDKYIASMYWAFTTMTTVGYGDIAAVTRTERFFACLGMLAGGFCFSSIVAGMSESMAAVSLATKAHAEKMDLVLAFSTEHLLKPDLHKEVMNCFRVQPVVPYDRAELLRGMPFDLRVKVVNYIFKPTIRTVSFIKQSSGQKGTPDDRFLVDFCSRLQSKVMDSDRIIYMQGQAFPDEMFMLLTGAVRLVRPDQQPKEIAAVLRKGETFGTGKLFGDSVRSETATTEMPCELMTCSVDELEPLFSCFPAAFAELERSIEKQNKQLWTTTTPKHSSIDQSHVDLGTGSWQHGTPKVTAQVSRAPAEALEARIRGIELQLEKMNIMMETILEKMSAP